MTGMEVKLALESALEWRFEDSNDPHPNPSAYPYAAGFKVAVDIYSFGPEVGTEL